MCCDVDSDTEPTYVPIKTSTGAATNGLTPVIPSDYSSQLTFLLRYPTSAAQDSSTPLPIHSSTLLIRQALTLQMSPTPATGVSIVHENRNLLGIPIEVPESPPPPTRRRPRVDGRGHSVSEVNVPGTTRTHARQGSSPMGLPEMIARNLIERGESLGINKTVMNAVSELKVGISLTLVT